MKLTYSEWQREMRKLRVVLRKGRLPLYSKKMLKKDEIKADKLIDKYPEFYDRQVTRDDKLTT